MTSLEPAVDGVTVEVYGDDAFLVLRVEPGHEVLVRGYEDDPEAPPAWEQAASGGTYAWHDHGSLEWLPSRSPAAPLLLAVVVLAGLGFLVHHRRATVVPLVAAAGAARLLGVMGAVPLLVGVLLQLRLLTAPVLVGGAPRCQRPSVRGSFGPRAHRTGATAVTGRRGSHHG